MPNYSETVLSTPNLAAYWRLGESSGTTAVDTSGNGLTMTYTGSPTLGVAGLLTDDPSTAINVNGTTQYAVRTTHASLQGGAAVSVECWVVGDATGNKCPVGFFGSGTDKGYWLNLNTNIQFWISLDGSAQTSADSGDTTVTGTRYHIVGTYDGTTIRLYVNGFLKDTTAAAGTIHTVTTANSFAIGRLGANNSDYFDGTIDEVAVYNRVLSADEVLLHYFAGSTGAPWKNRASAPTDALIARPGWFDQRMVPIGPPQCSWRTDGPGSFDCEIETRTLTTMGYALTAISNALKGKWLWWDHPTAGPWGGVITRADVGPYITRITAEQFNVLLRKRRTAAAEAATGIAPGSLALYYLTSAERNGDSFMLTGWSAEESGAAVDLEPRGGDLCDDILPQLAGFGYQWRVRAWALNERLFEFRTRLGTDKRNTVLLSDGRSIVGMRVTGDLWTVANSIIGINGDRDWKQAAGYQQDDDGSVRALGRRYETTIAYSGVVTRSTIAPLVKRDLAVMKYPQEIAEVEVVDEDLIWLEFREGDTVSVMSAHCNYHGPFQIDIRSLDARTNIMTVAGRLLTEAVS